MSPVNELSSKTYRGIWRILIRAFRVPHRPPVLPTAAGENYEAFKPAIGFLRYMKFSFWASLLVSLTISIVASVFGFQASAFWTSMGMAAAILIQLLIFPLGYLAIHLRYDTTWYVFNNRSMRLRRGIWKIRESTITFENVQNVKITQGPLQRLFGIHNLIVETAGGGSAQIENTGKHTADHIGLIEGVADAKRIQQMILSKLKNSMTSGLGDEQTQLQESLQSSSHVPELNNNQLAVLREIRDISVGMSEHLAS